MKFCSKKNIFNRHKQVFFMEYSKIHYSIELENLIKTNNLIVLLNCPYCPFLNIKEYMFGDLKINCLIYYGIFSIDKNDILQHPVTRYEVLIKDLSDHSNPEVGHYFERSWCAVFHPLKNTNVIKYNKL